MLKSKTKPIRSNPQKKDLILAIDQGTTGTTAFIIDRRLNLVAMHSVDFRQIFPQPGLVEHDLNDIWGSTTKAVTKALRSAQLSANRIAAIGITNQRETCAFWNKTTLEPLDNAIVWQDRRTAAYCEELKKTGFEKTFTKKTGLLLDPYFSCTKLNWFIRNNKSISAAIKNKNAAAGTMDTYVLTRLTNGVVHATEPSNASRTGLFNIETNTWDATLLQKFEVPLSVLPNVRDSAGIFGYTKNLKFLPDGIPITGILGDQQAALFGQNCLNRGEAKCTYGTGSFILMNTGTTLRRSKHRLLSTIAWQIAGETTYALEGGAFTAGATVQWLRDGLELFKTSAEVEKLARKVASSEGVTFVPAFVGVGAPHWLPHARAMICGISRGTNRAHIARAALEGIALMNADILHAMQDDLGEQLIKLRVDGGASENTLLMEIQAQLLGCRLERPKMVESTSLGAALIAGLGNQWWPSLQAMQGALSRSLKVDKIFQRDSKQAPYYQKISTTWGKIIEQCLV